MDERENKVPNWEICVATCRTVPAANRMPLFSEPVRLSSNAAPQLCTTTFLRFPARLRPPRDDAFPLPVIQVRVRKF